MGGAVFPTSAARSGLSGVGDVVGCAHAEGQSIGRTTAVNNHLMITPFDTGAVWNNAPRRCHGRSGPDSQPYQPLGMRQLLPYRARFATRRFFVEFVAAERI